MELTGATITARSNSWIILILCCLAAAMDGFDAAILGYSVPLISTQWHVPLPEFGIALSASAIGIVLGALVLTPLGDRIGRRPLLIVTSAEIAVATIAIAFAGNIWELTALRFATGIGLGTLTPLVAAVAYEAPDDDRRNLYVTTLMVAFPVGAFFGGLIAAWILPRFGWQALFVGTGMAMALVGLGSFLFYKERRPASGQSVASGNPESPSPSGIVVVLRDHRAMTFFFWILFIGNLFLVYTLTSWLPTLLTRAGLDMGTAAALTSLINLGGSVGGLALGFLVARFGITALVVSNLAAGATLMLFPMAHSAALLAILCTTIGFLIIGGYVCNVAVATARYPTQVRLTGVGWAQGIGRLGAIGAPAAIAFTLHQNWSNDRIFTAISVVALFCAAAAQGLKAPKR